MASIEEQNKDIVNRLVREVIGTGELERADEFFAEDFVQHGIFFPPGFPSGVAGWKKTIRLIRDNFPDLNGTNDILLADGDYVVNLSTVRGTHKRLDKPIEVLSMHITRLKNGKIVEQWSIYENMKVLQQLGVISSFPNGVEWFGMPQQG